MLRLVISPAAQRDLQTILAWTHEQFGPQSRRRYETLLVRSLLDLSEDPQRAGSQSRPEIAPGVRTYHLRYSRDRAAAQDSRVRRPRHFVLYRTTTAGQVEIGRILHDRMEISLHAPDDFAADTPE